MTAGYPGVMVSTRQLDELGQGCRDWLHERRAPTSPAGVARVRLSEIAVPPDATKIVESQVCARIFGAKKHRTGGCRIWSSWRMPRPCWSGLRRTSSNRALVTLVLIRTTIQ